jgi:hypothetical protein
MSYNTYQTTPGQYSYSRQRSQSQCRQYAQSQSYGHYPQTQSYGRYSQSQAYGSIRRPAISSKFHIYHNPDSDDSGSDLEYESDSEDERPLPRDYGYHQATHGSMHEQERAQNVQRYRQQQVQAESRRVLETGYGSVHTASTRPMGMLTQGLYSHTPAGQHYADYQRADRSAHAQQASSRSYYTQNVQGSGSGIDRRVQTLRRGGVTRETARRHYY